MSNIPSIIPASGDFKRVIIPVKDEVAGIIGEQSERLHLYQMRTGVLNLKFVIDPEHGLEGWEIDKLMADEIRQIQKVMRYEPTSGSQALVNSLHCGGRQQVNSAARAQNKNVVRSWIQGHGRKRKPTQECPLASAGQFNYLRGFRS